MHLFELVREREEEERETTEKEERKYLKERLEKNLSLGCDVILLPPHNVEIYNFLDAEDLVLQLKYIETPTTTEGDYTSVPTMFVSYLYALVCWNRYKDFAVACLQKHQKQFLRCLCQTFAEEYLNCRGFNFCHDKLHDNMGHFLQHFLSKGFYESNTYDGILPYKERKDIISQCRISFLVAKDRPLPSILARDIMNIAMNSERVIHRFNKVDGSSPYSPYSPSPSYSTPFGPCIKPLGWVDDDGYDAETLEAMIHGCKGPCQKIDDFFKILPPFS